jgi:hypothetical protein
MPVTVIGVRRYMHGYRLSNVMRGMKDLQYRIYVTSVSDVNQVLYGFESDL